MKFYTVTVKDAELQDMTVVLEEDTRGQWATRAYTEQAAKDAVEMARIVQAHISNKAGDHFIAGTAYLHINSMEELYTLVIEQNEVWKQAQAIIEKYEGSRK